MPTSTPTLYYYGYSTHGMLPDYYCESFLIVNEQQVEKWYLRSYDQQTNQAVWTRLIKNAKEFDSEKEAIMFGKSINREFSVEEQEVNFW